jgi:hypothetical protein
MKTETCLNKAIKIKNVKSFVNEIEKSQWRFQYDWKIDNEWSLREKSQSFLVAKNLFNILMDCRSEFLWNSRNAFEINLSSFQNHFRIISVSWLIWYLKHFLSLLNEWLKVISSDHSFSSRKMNKIIINLWKYLTLYAIHFIEHDSFLNQDKNNFFAFCKTNDMKEKYFWEIEYLI